MTRAMVQKELGHEFKMSLMYTQIQWEKLQCFIEHLVKDAAEQSQDSKLEAILAYVSDILLVTGVCPRSKETRSLGIPFSASSG